MTMGRPELLDDGDDRMLWALLHDFFAFGRNLEESRAKLARYIGLSSTQYIILIAIAYTPKDEPLGISQIAGKMYLSGAFVTIEVNKLEAEGLVDKTAHPTDGRRVQLAITAEGFERLRRLAAFQRSINDALFGMLSHEEVRLLAGLLARLAANGGNVVRMASHIEATMGLALHRNPLSDLDGKFRR